jgi:hypothetical protein
MAARKGHAVSSETRAKLSAAARGKKHPHKGHAVTAATRAKLSAAAKGKPHKGHAVSSATRAKISAALKGKPHKGHAVSAATRIKISAALKARHTAAPKKKRPTGAPTRQPRTALGRRGTVKPHKPRGSAYSLISAGAGYHRSLTGHLRPKRTQHAGTTRVRPRRSAHHVRPRRRA